MKSTSMIAWIGTLLLGAVACAVADEQRPVTFAGKFTVPLESGWSWLREEPKGWQVEDGALRIRALPGHLFAKYNDARNVLLRKAPEISRPFAVEVVVESQPKLLFEEAGLFWYYDDDNYICLVKEQLGKDVTVRMYREKAGVATFQFEKKHEAEAVFFRLLVGGGKATGYYRQTDQPEWQKMGQADLLDKGDAKIGLNAAGGPKDTDRWARFRDFRILEAAE